MRKYVSISIKDLVSDIPVDPIHVRELADSIMTRGQLAPIIVREETKDVIDGFHRIAAMKELGFNEVECVLTPCDDEGFWDFRIIQASMHKNITFARAIDWIERVFQLSSLYKSSGGGEYKSAYRVFAAYRTGNPTKEVRQWVETKAATWGLAPKTIEDWLYTKQKLAPDLLKEATSLSQGERRGFDTYKTVAAVLPTPELQKRVVEKAKAEDLSSRQVREVAQALRRAGDEEEVQNILRQPVSRTEDQMVRDAKVEKLLSHPREITPLEKWQEAKHEDVLYKLDLLGIINSTRAMTPEKISVLTPAQKADVYRTCEEAITEIRRVMDMIKSGIKPEYLLKGAGDGKY
jgi:ParB-like chromosome segregation protein Spo0J